MTNRKQIAFGLAAMVALSVAWRAFTATGQDNDITVCVGPDAILRSPASGMCPNGSEQIKLSRSEIKKLDSVDDNDTLGPTKKKESELDRRLAELENRVKDLENGPLFEVVNKKGDVIFSVGPGRAQ